MGDGPIVSDSRHLTTALAERDPTAFKLGLIDALGNTHKFGSSEFDVFGALTKRAWNFLSSTGEWDFDAIVLNTSTWIGHNGKTLELGIQDMPADVADRVIFLDHEFKGDRNLFYRFSHELSHSLVARASTAPFGKNLLELFEYARTLRAMDSSCGLSALGSLRFYQDMGPVIQATEDITELVNLQLLNPKYLDAYLRFVSNPSLARQCREIGVCPRDTEQAHAISSVVSRVVSSTLNISPS